MRIMIALHDIQDFGGIINHAELLGRGLKELGHDVCLRRLEWKDRVVRSSKAERNISEQSVFGVPFDQRSGWNFTPEMRVPYKGAANLRQWRSQAREYDLIIWEIPVPTGSKQNAGNTDWLKLYAADVPQIAVVHDGNALQAYPWLGMVSQHLVAIVGVHGAGYRSALELPHTPTPVAFIPNPQDVEPARRLLMLDDTSLPWSAETDSLDELWKSKPRGFLSLQTFKRWKRVDDLVRAIPHMQMDMHKDLAGGGIEYYYMTSKDKLKPDYRWKKEDADVPPRATGRPIWKVAEKYGMNFHGYLDTAARDAILQKRRLLIDSSWSRKYAKIGSHFNRVAVDGILQGCIPIARNLGISDNEDGRSEYFTPLGPEEMLHGRPADPKANYIMIPYDATPKEYARIVDTAMNLPPSWAAAMMKNGLQMVVENFDHKLVAQSYVRLVTHSRTKPVHNKTHRVETRQADKQQIKAAKEAYKKAFT